ncbi:MAG TPA: DUF4157 domain-containing protein [Kineosporiaceae bacterium]|nr:DUF4157 domain-containing protein [Kineosporiaceae bacterium]
MTDGVDEAADPVDGPGEPAGANEPAPAPSRPGAPAPLATEPRPVVRRGVPTWYRRALVAAVVVALLVPAVHGALWVAQAPGSSAEPVAGGPSTPAPGPGAATGQLQAGNVPPPTAAAVADLLARRSAAVLARDRAGWLSTLDSRVPGLVAAQGEVFARIALVRPVSWRYQVLSADDSPPATGGSLPAGAVLAHVRLAYRLAASAPEVTRDQHLTLTRRDGWLVAGTDAGTQQRDPWDLGPVTVARTARTVVVASSRSSLPAERTAREADAAASRVDRVWGTDWPRTAVLYLPADLDEMAALLGRSSATGLDQLAAVTTGESGGGTGSRTTGDRVVLNPAGFAQLTATGRDAVLAHELTHVATRASVRDRPPLWVDEGFADYVAYLGSPLRTRDLAADVLTSPAEVAGLAELPADEKFDPAAGRVGPAYAEAWLAMRFVAQQGGTAQVVDFYRVAVGLEPLRRWPGAPPPSPALTPRTPLEHACLDVTGFVYPSFVRRWVAYVRALAAQ